MKKVAVTVAVLALGLAACEGTTDDPAIKNEIAVEEEAVTDVDAAVDGTAEMSADNALENATEAVNTVENAAENASEALENIAE